MANLSQQKREKMMDFLEVIRQINKKDDNALIAISEIENDLNEKKFGLVWEQHEEAVDVQMRENIPVFTECKEKEINAAPGDGYNFILEGDNLHSLKLLEKTHSGKIDVIYIDPPYNTEKNDFVYDDKCVGINDLYRHSKWLSFMSERLSISKKLLSDDGFIMISIDDNEFSQLKLLCDEIFGEENRLSTHHIQVRYKDKSLNEKSDWQPIMEYVLIYAKNKSKLKIKRPYQEYDVDDFVYSFEELTPGEKITLGGKNVTVFKKGEWKIKKAETGEIGLLKGTWASGSVINGNASGKFFDTYISKRKEEDGLSCLYKVEGIGEDGLGYRYFTGPKRATAIRGMFYSGVPINRVEELRTGHSKKYNPIINYYDFSADFGNISHEGGIPFNDGKKPVKMLKQFINYHPKKDALVLDFFAGSGSTAQAVLELNVEDGGDRHFILCNNNENNICENITYTRCKNVITSCEYKHDDKTVIFSHEIKLSDFKDASLNDEIEHKKKEYKKLYKRFETEIKNNYLYLYGVNNSLKMKGISSNLKYFRTDFVPKNSEDVTDELLNHISEMVELENGIKLDGKEYVLILSDDEANELEKHWGEYLDIKALYISNDVLLTTSQRVLFSNVKIHIISDYYFKFEMQK